MASILNSYDGTKLQSALNAYGRDTQLTTLLAWWPRMFYVWSNGRMGSLRFSARREGRALASAARVGELDARACNRDQHSPITPADTAHVVAETSTDLSAEIDAYMNHIIMRSRMSQIGAASRLPLRSFIATFVVVTIVVAVDWFLNEPLVSRLGFAGATVHLASILIALASLIFAHYVVVGTPPGRRNRTRVVLIVLAVLGFLLFVGPGAYLRSYDPQQTDAGPPPVGLDVPEPDTSLVAILLKFVPLAVMIGLMSFTTAVAALIALRNETRRDEVRADGTSQRLADLLTEAQVATAYTLQKKVVPLTNRLIAAHTASFRQAAPAGVEVEAPEPAPLTTLSATSAAGEKVRRDMTAESHDSPSGSRPRREEPSSGGNQESGVDGPLGSAAGLAARPEPSGPIAAVQSHPIS